MTNSERIKSLEDNHIWYWRALLSIAALGLSWLSWNSIQLYSMKGDLQAIKQKLADGGIGSIVAEIQKPASPNQLAANLSLVASQVRIARVEGKSLNQENIAKLSAAVIGAARDNPEMPEVWQAASQLATTRASIVPAVQSIPETLPECDVKSAKATTEIVPARGGNYYKFGFRFKNCALYLDSLPPILGSVGFDFRTGQTTSSSHEESGGYANIPIFLNDGVVEYTGVTPLYNPMLVLRNCRLQFKVLSVPDQPGRRLLLAAMETANTGYVSTSPGY